MLIPPAGVQLSGDLTSLATALPQIRRISLDFETSGQRGIPPHKQRVGGVGIYDPETNRGWYINCGHHVSHPLFPRYSEADLAAVLAPFLADSTRAVVMFNSNFDLLFLFYMGCLNIRCRVIDTMIWMHRLDPNLAAADTKVDTNHPTLTLNYKLKTLVPLFLGYSAPHLLAATGNQNVLLSDPAAVAEYCMHDVKNTAALLTYAEARLHGTSTFQVLRSIEDPCAVVTAFMLYCGVGIDPAALRDQQDGLQQAVRNCETHIQQLLNVDMALGKDANLAACLHTMGYTTHKEHSITHEELHTLFQAASCARDREAIACMMILRRMRGRINDYVVPIARLFDQDTERVYIDYFTTMTFSGRYSCQKPNFQGFSSRLEHPERDTWVQAVPEHCISGVKPKNLIRARLGSVLVNFDLKSAEPRYVAMRCQQALREKETVFLQEKREKEKNRWRAYPYLMKLKKQLQKEYGYSDTSIRWSAQAEDPLHAEFCQPGGGDPYNALLQAVQADDPSVTRDEIKTLYLSLVYGAGVESRAEVLGWTVERAQKALDRIYNTYTTFSPLKELTAKYLWHFGEIKNLYGRSCRINGYYQLCQPHPVVIKFSGKPYHSREWYRAEIIPLGTTTFGIQAFVKHCAIMDSMTSTTGITIFRADENTGDILLQEEDPFFTSDTQFNRLPFRNFGYGIIRYVEEANGLRRFLPREQKAQRTLFNAVFQSTGADHLKSLVYRMHQEVCTDTLAACHLILTVHDSLVYEVPDGLVRSFLQRAVPVLETPPPWADIPFPVETAIGTHYGDLQEPPAVLTFTQRIVALWRSWFTFIKIRYRRVVSWLRTRGRARYQ